MTHRCYSGGCTIPPSSVYGVPLCCQTSESSITCDLVTPPLQWFSFLPLCLKFCLNVCLTMSHTANVSKPPVSSVSDDICDGCRTSLLTRGGSNTALAHKSVETWTFQFSHVMCECRLNGFLLRPTSCFGRRLSGKNTRPAKFQMAFRNYPSDQRRRVH